METVMCMSYLSGVVMIFGAVLAMVGAPMMFAPAKAISFIRGFPRNKIAGWLLVAVDLAWSAWLLLQMDMGWLEKWKPLVYVLAPIAFFLIVNFMDELLAARALGGLFLILPAPILDASQWHSSLFRLFIVVMAYIVVIAGMALALSPFRFRKTMQLITDNQKKCRFAGLIGLVLGMFIIGLGITVFA
jgi:hypothetical protein